MVLPVIPNTRKVGASPRTIGNGGLADFGLTSQDLGGFLRGSFGGGVGPGGGMQIQNSSGSSSSVSVNPSITVIGGSGSPGISTSGSSAATADQNPSQSGEFGMPGGGIVPGFGPPQLDQFSQLPAGGEGGLGLDGLILPALLAGGAFLLTQGG